MTVNLLNCGFGGHMSQEEETKTQCGAKTRDGTLCNRHELGRGGRCRLHGGLSTGPKTLAGRRRSALNIGKDYDSLLEIKLQQYKNLS